MGRTLPPWTEGSAHHLAQRRRKVASTRDADLQWRRLAGPEVAREVFQFVADFGEGRKLIRTEDFVQEFCAA